MTTRLVLNDPRLRERLQQELEAHARMLLNVNPEEPLLPPTMNFVREEEDRKEVTFAESESSMLGDDGETIPSYFGAATPVSNEEPLPPPEMDFEQRA